MYVHTNFQAVTVYFKKVSNKGRGFIISHQPLILIIVKLHQLQLMCFLISHNTILAIINPIQEARNEIHV